MNRRLLILGAVGALGFLAAAPAARQQRPQAVFADGMAQIVPAFQDQREWIRETLWVEASFDSDRDGKPDRLFTDVTRQYQTDTEGLKVPVIYGSSPYFAGTSNDRSKLWNVNHEIGDVPPQRLSQPPVVFRPKRERVSDSFVNDWVPRGFAVVHSEAPGTGLSQGCPTVGDIPERFAPKAVIDWLNGRAKAYRTIDGTEEVKATWATGKVGMTGTSYDGTIPVAAATTGVEGLAAIIPVAPNTSYYHYYRSNGLVRHPGGWLGEDIDYLYDFINSGDPARHETCAKLYRDGEFAANRDRTSGDYNEFWKRRDLLPLTNNIKAAVLMAHAFNDWNVVPEHSVRIYEALKGRVPLQAYYHQDDHGGSPPFDMMNRWFTRYLYGVENGVEKQPKAWIVREAVPAATPAPAAGGRRGGSPRMLPTPYADYPNPAARMQTFYLRSGGRTAGGLTTGRQRGQGRETLTDNVEFGAQALALAAESPHRLIYSTEELKTPWHLSGTAQVTIRLASSKPAANLSVYLVILPWASGPVGTTNLITRGWADPQNHDSLRRGGNYDSMEHGKPLKAGEFVTLTFDLQPDDQIIPAGKRIGLMILSSDRDFTLRPKPGTELTIDLDATTVRIPIVGGVPAGK
jgi:X-Pro dipeptidyl-peptidase